MIKRILSFACLPLVLAGCSSDETAGPSAGPNPDWTLTRTLDLTDSDRETTDKLNEFSHRLMAEAQAESAEGEFCISPLSVSIYLGMLANGTVGEGHDQIMDALGTDDIAGLNSLYKKFMHYLPCEENGSCVWIANRFWVNRNRSVPDAFCAVAAEVFNAGVEYVDFGSSRTVPAINRWVSDNTRGLIPSLLDGDWEEYRMSSMASANAIYFKGDWRSKFSPEMSGFDTFHGLTADSETSMMRQSLVTGYAESPLAQMVTLAFEGKSVMELYLPAEGVDIRNFVSALTPGECGKLRTAAGSCRVTLSIPAFENASRTDIARILGRIGVTSLDNMDFSPMGLGVMPAVLTHKTSIRIDEEGAELAAVTGGTVESSRPEKDLPEIKIDFNRPFMYIIRNTDSGAILMAGTVTGFK